MSRVNTAYLTKVHLFWGLQTYVKEHPDYEENQKSRNRELDDVLAQRDGQEVVLYEVLDEDGKKPRKLHKDSQHLDPSEVRIKLESP